MNQRRLAAELVGTAFLLAAIVGSGIAGSVDGPDSSKLFQHAVVVGAALAALIFTFGPLSGGHFNPVVTLVDAIFGGIPWRQAAGYVAVQIIGAVIGVAIANGMFGEPVLAVAATPRVGVELAVSEAVATFGLVVVVFGTVRLSNPSVVPVAVGAYIAAVIYSTSSGAFANPAVTLGRMLTDTWTGMAPSGLRGFLAAQAVGALVAAALVAYLFHPSATEARRVALPHETAEEAHRG